jgi:hypothetical protein
MKTDKHGCSTCPIGEEHYEFFSDNLARANVQYDYRASNGELFSCVRRGWSNEQVLRLAKSTRDKWLEERGLVA